MKPEQRYLFFQESVCTEIQDEYPLIQMVSDNGVSSSSLPKKTAENTRWIYAVSVEAMEVYDLEIRD